MVENREKVYCYISPNTVDGGYCPENCGARSFCATVESVIVNRDAGGGFETTITKRLAKKISHTPQVKVLAQKLIDSGIRPTCSRHKRQ